ncbi:hypothetical protein MLD38_020919 [Melastoma candidum]|nr:hypothetical protein MLD38_020919 [Melastoma candidum]
MDGHEYRALVDRCLRLESSQYELRDQLSELTLGSGPPSCFPGVWKKGGAPYRRVLELMGSAVFVSSSPSLQILYW